MVIMGLLMLTLLCVCECVSQYREGLWETATPAGRSCIDSILLKRRDFKCLSLVSTGNNIKQYTLSHTPRKN